MQQDSDSHSNRNVHHQRRQFLQTLGAAGIVATAGCIGDEGENDETETPGETETAPNDGGPSETPVDLEPAVFELSAFEPTDTELESGTTFTPSVTVTNTGGEEGTRTVEYRLADETVDTVSVSLGPGDDESVSFEAIDTDDRDPGWYTHGVASGDTEQVGSFGIVPSDPIDKLLYRYRWEHVTGEGRVDHDDPQIQSLVEELDSTVESQLNEFIEDPEDRIWPEHPLGEGNPEADEPWRTVQRSFREFHPLAEAYVMPTSAYEGDPEVLETIRRGYEFLADYYYAGLDTYGNWWQWEIGIPDRLLHPLLILGNELPDDLVDHYIDALDDHMHQPDIGAGSGDLASGSWLWLRYGLVARDGDVIREVGRDPLTVTLEYSAQNNIYPDGSSIDHGIFPYNLHYQGRFLNDITSIARFLRGSPWSLNQPDFPGNLNLLYYWAYEAFEPLMWRGQAMSMVLGRHQNNNTEKSHGRQIIRSFIRLGDIAPPPHDTNYKRIAKGWIERNTYSSYLEETSSIPTYADLSDLLNDDSIPPREPLERYKQYYNNDRAVHHETSYALGLAMLSQRIGNYEVLSDGVRGPTRGWFTSYGMTYFYTDDLAQYNDAYWQTVDPERPPGTTTNPALTDSISEGTTGNTAHAGGVEFEERYGTSSMVLRSVVDPDRLSAHKSWFCFGESVVALGSAISGEGGDRQIATTAGNRNLGDEDDGTVRIDGEEATEAAPTDVEMTNVGWAHLDRSPESIGYVFPENPSVRVVREENNSDDPDTGTRDVNRFSNNTYVRYFAKLLLEHGSDPDGAGYTYAVLPDADAETTAEYHDDPPFEVLERSEAVHAVEHTEHSLTGIQAFEEATVGETGITVDGPAAVMYRETDDEVTVAIADPTQQRDAIAIQLPVAVSDSEDVDAPISIRNTDPLELSVATNMLRSNRQGKTMTATFTR
jgi:hyaluronate lyase